MQFEKLVDQLNFLNLSESEFLGNSLKNWLAAGVFALIVYVGLSCVRYFILKRLKKIADKTPNRLDDLVLDLLSGTRKLFIAFIAIYAGSLLLKMPDRTAKLLHSIFVVGLLVQAWFWGSCLLKILIAKLLRRDGKDVSQDAIEGTRPAIEFVGRLILFSIIVLLALENFGFDVTALVASLGIGGIAVALALQNILGDLFASLSILFDKPFKVGDFVVVGDLAGTVEKIGLKTTRVRSLSGEQLVISNGDLLSSRIRNYKRMNERRIVFEFGVTYQTSSENLKKIPQMLKQIIESIQNTRFDRAHFFRFSPSSLDFQVVYYVLSPNYSVYMDIQQEINLRLFSQFAKEGIRFAHPVQSLFLAKTPALEESLKNVGT